MVRKVVNALGYLSVLFLLQGVISWNEKPAVFKNGMWRVELERPDGKQIVFNFQTKDSAGKKVLYVLNASERLLVDNIRLKNDSVFIDMPFFESSFRGKLDDQNHLQGVWIKNLGTRNQVMPFKATYNQKQRFPDQHKPKYNVTVRWAATFKGAEETTAVGIFEQNGGRVSGTFLTSSGDYRYLEGVVSVDSLKLSGFDGGHAFLFTAKVENDHQLSGGKFYSGAVGLETWTAEKDSAAALPDGYEQTHLRAGESKLNFHFTSIDGKDVSIKDDRYKNKVILIQIMGSWCPNCMDETAFLSDYYSKHQKDGFEVLGLAYERTTDFNRSKASLERFRQRFHVQYPILVTGVTLTDPLRSEKTLPQLDGIKAFPTTIFIDRKGNVRKIYTGFSGPGTGQYFEEFKKEFDQTVSSLLAEQPGQP